MHIDRGEGRGFNRPAHTTYLSVRIIVFAWVWDDRGGIIARNLSLALINPLSDLKISFALFETITLLSYVQNLFHFWSSSFYTGIFTLLLFLHINFPNPHPFNIICPAIYEIPHVYITFFVQQKGDFWTMYSQPNRDKLEYKWVIYRTYLFDTMIL